MATHAESPNNRMFGYLQYKGKKKLISFWRKYYCVLSGRILIFYTSESAYQNLENYHHSLDLGLVYAVHPALGTENAIQISTHLGPQWLRAREESSYKSWLSALERACNLSAKDDNASETEPVELYNIPSLAEEHRDRRHHRERKALSINVGAENFKFTGSGSSKDLQRKNSSSKRISLNFVPGHGGKYASLDAIRTLDAADSVCADVDADVDQQTSKPEVASSDLIKRRIKKEVQETRPLSSSVSDFLLLNSPTKKEAPCAKATSSSIVKKRILQNPRLPTNNNLNKLLLHAGNLTETKQDKEVSNDRRHVKSMSNLSLPENKVGLSARATSDSRVDSPSATVSFQKEPLLLRLPSEEPSKSNAEHAHTEPKKVTQENPGDEAGDVSPPADDVASVSDAIDGTEEQSNGSIAPDSAEECSKKKGKRSGKRRKSGLEKLMYFLKFTKTSKCKSEGNQADAAVDTKDVQTLDQQGEASDDKCLETASSDNPQEDGNDDTAVDEQQSKTHYSEPQPLYEQQISEGRESVGEEPIIAEKAFECGPVANADSDQIDGTQLDQPGEPRRKTSIEPFLVQSRQRKYSADSMLTQQIMLPRSRRPSTQSFESDGNNRSSRNVDARRSTIRALDFNFDLSTLDVVVNDSLPLPAKTRCRAPSPGTYDKPRTLCKHCSVPIIQLVIDDVSRNQEVKTNKKTSISLTDMLDNHQQEHGQSKSGTAISSSLVLPNTSGKNERTKGKIAGLVRFFDEKPENASLECPKDERNRLSYALTEEVVVIEETLKPIDTDDNLKFD